MAHHNCLLGRHCHGSQKPLWRHEELELKRQQIPQKDVVFVLLQIPHDQDQDVELADIGIVHIDKVDLKCIVEPCQRVGC